MADSFRDALAETIDELDGDSEPEQAARAFWARFDDDPRFRTAIRRGLKKRQAGANGKGEEDDDER